MLFKVVRGRIEFCMGLGPKSWTTEHVILALDPHRFEYTAMSGPMHRGARLTARNGYVAQFSFLMLNVSPFFQMVSAIAAMCRANVSRAISGRTPRRRRPSRYVRYGSV